MGNKQNLEKMRSSVWRLFLTTHLRVIDRIEAKLAEAELPSLEWYDVLLTLKESPEYRLRLSDLADKVLLSRSNLTRLIDRLEKAGLLYRQRCPTDRRGTFAVLTPQGLTMQKRMWPVYAEGIVEYFACHMNDSEVSVIQEVMERMLAAAKESQNVMVS
ncbi:MAG: MarR family transcriptional regulator [Rhizonema sp. NSF051]|nr:MarR family transcriptional regulator [Rhizonema sp. NSF051]